MLPDFFMKRLMFLLKRWLCLFRIKRFRNKPITGPLTLNPFTNTLLLSIQYLKLIDSSLYSNLDIRVLRRMEVTIHYRLEETLNILNITNEVLNNVTNNHKGGTKYITADIVRTSGNRSITLAKYLSDTDGRALVLPEYINYLREILLEIYQHLIKLEDESDEWYYTNRLKLVFQDIYVIVETLIKVLESNDE